MAERITDQMQLRVTPGNTPRTDTRVVFAFRGGRKELLARIASDVAPDEFLYGFTQARQQFPMTAIVEAEHSTSIFAGLFRLVPLITCKLGFGLFFNAPFSNLRTLQAASVIVATTDSTGIPLLIMKRCGVLRAAIIVISQGLHSIGDETAALPWSDWLKRRLGYCLAEASAIVALGDGDAEAIAASFSFCRLPEVRIIQFGIDAAFWHPGDPETAQDGFVLSVGSDRLRDYPTLLEAIDTTPLHLVTRLPIGASYHRPSVRLESDLEWVRLRDLYQRARFVVTPVKDQPRDSGHSATLQAMACGKAVILSNIAGLWDRERMVHGETCYLVEPGNVQAMREAIAYLYSRPEEAARIGRNARQLVVDSYSSAEFGSRLSELITEHATDRSAKE